MPAKYRLRQYVENGVYHIFNRGVEKRNIFIDTRDYHTFLYLLKLHLTKPINDPEKTFNTHHKNFADEIELLAYCLMPNHFHLLVKQKNAKSIAKFMQCFLTKYAMFFNNRYDRSGTLFQGRYRACLVGKDNYLLHLSRYIHLNPSDIKVNPLDYKFSSYKDYIGLKDTEWINTDLILDYFGARPKRVWPFRPIQGYKEFVESLIFDSNELLGKLTLE